MALHPTARTCGRGRSSVRPRVRRVLVATDGTPASAGALAMASQLASRDGAAVHVVSILELWGPPVPPHEVLGEAAEVVVRRLSHVLPQLRSTFGATGSWRLRIMEGRVAPAIAGAVAARDYDLVIVGCRRRWLDRLLGRSTALGVAAHAPIPVLAVPPAVRELPRRVVVGFDGGTPALEAAAAALRLVDVPATVHAVRVVDRRETATARARAEAQARGAVPLAASLVPEIDGEGAIVIRPTVLHGDDPAAALTTFARAAGAELIALGSRQSTLPRGGLRGGTARRVLRSAECCVPLSGNCAAGPPDASSRRSSTRGVGEGAADEPRGAHQAVQLGRLHAADVPHADAERRQHVRDEAAMAPPPEDLGAEDRAPEALGDRQ